MKLLHVSFWFGQVREPIEYAWREDLSWINDVVGNEFMSIYNINTLKLAVF